ncbi:hypothetical protein ACH4F6_07550 [Streptomyces sp. NPDC017936]|uniref:hypothetical protein n=1 Tax=Streptomyces sp. NPDC017936 TaxID=3365016 RepID=UPI0037BD04A4
MRAARTLGVTVGAAALVGTSFVVAGPAAATGGTAKAPETVVVRSATSTGGTALAQPGKGRSAPASRTMRCGSSSHDKCDIVGKPG